jgi:SAM-dependent methyltransferase
MTQEPAWKALAKDVPGWTWQGSVLRQDGALEGSMEGQKTSGGLGRLVVEYIYGRQNKTRSVRRIVEEAVARLGSGEFGLNFGSGRMRFSPAVLNLDLMAGAYVDIVSAGTLDIPFKDCGLSLIICQEVLEHVDRPRAAVAEFHRVLKLDGELVLQLPFIIGYHPGPKDFWRFSTEAYEVLLPSDKWKIVEKQLTVGHGSGLHRILTEFIAVHFSVFGGKIYRLVKGFSAVALCPLILFDVLTPYLPEKDRIPGGYIVKARVVK